MKYAGNGIFNRHDLSWIFGKKTKRVDEECWKMERFLIGTLSECGYGCQDIGSLLDFMRETTVNFVHIRKWFASFDDEKPAWIRIKKQSDEFVWALFRNGVKTGRWTYLI